MRNLPGPVQDMNAVPQSFDSRTVACVFDWDLHRMGCFPSPVSMIEFLWGRELTLREHLDMGASIGAGSGPLQEELERQLPILRVMNAEECAQCVWMVVLCPIILPSLPKSKREAAEILGVALDASHQEIRKAHIRRLREVHPDKFPHASQAVTEWCTAAAKAANTARELLLS